MTVGSTDNKKTALQTLPILRLRTDHELRESRQLLLEASGHTLCILTQTSSKTPSRKLAEVKRFTEFCAAADVVLCAMISKATPHPWTDSLKLTRLVAPLAVTFRHCGPYLEELGQNQIFRPQQPFFHCRI